mgnify:CR=1 FL=1
MSLESSNSKGVEIELLSGEKYIVSFPEYIDENLVSEEIEDWKDIIKYIYNSGIDRIDDGKFKIKFIINKDSKQDFLIWLHKQLCRTDIRFSKKVYRCAVLLSSVSILEEIN